MDCAVEGCEDEATFRLHVPWDDDLVVCAGHARVRARQDGVVADPLDSAGDQLPRGASHRGNVGRGDGGGDGEGDGDA